MSTSYINGLEVYELSTGEVLPKTSRRLEQHFTRRLRRHYHATWGCEIPGEMKRGAEDYVQVWLMRLSERYPEHYFKYSSEYEDAGWDECMTYYWICRGKIIERYPEVKFPELNPHQLLEAIA